MVDTLLWAYKQLDGQSAFSLNLTRAGYHILQVKGCSLEGQGEVKNSLKATDSTTVSTERSSLGSTPSSLSLVTDTG